MSAPKTRPLLDWLATAACSSLLVVALRALLGEATDWLVYAIFWAIPIGLASIVTYLLRAHRSPKLFAAVLASRLVVVTIVVGTLIVASAFLWYSEAPQPLEITSLGTTAVTGVIVGLLLRMSIATYTHQLLTGRQTEVIENLVILSIAAGVFLVPGLQHDVVASLPGELEPGGGAATFARRAAATYSIAAGIGFLVHFGVRTGQRNRARQIRQSIALVEFVNDVAKGNELTPNELQAITNFAYGRKRRQNRFFASLDEEHWTPTLRIVKATMLRAEGNYGEARDEVEPLSRDADLTDGAKAVVKCLIGICEGELRHTTEMKEALDHALELSGGECMLSNLAQGLRMAEALPWHKPCDKKNAIQALAFCWKALQLNATSGRDISVLERVLGSGSNLTWTFLLEAYAYAALKAGDTRTAQTLFGSCMAQDPDFSSVYCHLAELHLLRMRVMSGDRQARSTYLAELCLLVARRMEEHRGRKGLLYHRVVGLLEELNEYRRD